MLPEKLEKIKEKMLKDYLSLQLLYVEFTSYVENKIKNILIENGIKYQSISSRVKTYDSLEKKLTQNIINGTHKNIKELSDLSGVRVIFYDEEELKKFNNILYDEFNIEKNRPSEDIMKYDGTNITLSLKKNISKFKGLLCEVQLTTVLSHAMNEFGHNIVYKDTDELDSKDSKEYENIKAIFSEVREDILKIMGKLEFINHRVYSIKSGAKNIEILLGKDFKNQLENVNSLNELEDVINKMVEIIPIIKQNEDKYKKIYDSGIIYAIVKKYSELPTETARILNYDTYEYKFGKLLDFLQSYKYLWLDDFKRIISILYAVSCDNNLVNKFNEFINRLIISDKADSGRGYASYNIHEIVYSLIFDKEIDEYIRIKFAECFCNLNYDYCEETGMNQISVINNKVNPNDNYIDKIYNVINIVLDIFITKNSKEALHSIISINCELERNTKIFNINPIYDFFDVNYDKIDIYSKNELYKSVCFWDDAKLKNSNFYKKLKNDKIQNLFAMLFNPFIEEIPKSRHDEKEEYRKKYLSDYINNFKNTNIKEIITILEIMDNENVRDLSVWNAGSFLINIGSLEKYGKKILEKKWNEFIFLGIMKQDKNFVYSLKNESEVNKIIDAMLKTGHTDLNVLNLLINYAENNRNEELIIKIMKFILNNIDLVSNEYYINFCLNKIKNYNKNKTGIMEELFHNPITEKKIIENYNHDSICILLENFRYSEFKNLDEFFINDLFEKYPDDLRILIKQKIEDNPNENLHNLYGHMNLSDCSNFNKERYNNLVLCLQLLKKNNCYKISNYIHYLIGEFNKNLEEDILKYLIENDNYDSYINVINLCRLFDTSTSCWKIYEHIISNIDSDDKLLDEIDCLLFNTGVVTGEYGIANSFNEKYNFFKNVKSKDKKVNDFIKTESSRFKVLYQNEKNKVDKEIIKNNTKYNLESKNNEKLDS